MFRGSVQVYSVSQVLNPTQPPTLVTMYTRLHIEKDEVTSEKEHARTMCLWSNECSTSPVNASHSFLKINRQQRKFL
ncbi:hypothetical protein Hanom_Chr09g00828201 [Helianthus anomalus]